MVDNTELSTADRALTTQLIREYSDCFVAPGGPLGRTSIVTHTMDTGSARPIKQRMRRLPQKQLEVVKPKSRKC